MAECFEFWAYCRSRDDRLNLSFVLWDKKGLRATRTDAKGHKSAAAEAHGADVEGCCSERINTASAKIIPSLLGLSQVRQHTAAIYKPGFSRDGEICWVRQRASHDEGVNTFRGPPRLTGFYTKQHFGFR